ncbi:MAG: dehypoxanthine futalosine cyclase [Candidatus Abyssobacteria bacterium SURF_17]|uniref:Cyclic dehypoxanthine futalosine synthase n=1 Tax=Candidatus Abyssobacteria bacterium SURF_17 TaxID=2093361 RepID=A0A419EWQ6_9BACT|nr:MAG: dehypoxanthine futalosine cyclase [Candidatus Abyssubacteria bacterium SURF_17]
MRHLPSITDILRSVLEGQRLGENAAAALFHSSDFLTIGAAAAEIRKRFHPAGHVTYVIDRNINYTNICVSGCTFCAFYRSPGMSDAYVLSRRELAQKIKETVELGGTQILLQGGLHPDLRLQFYCDMLRFIKREFKIHIHGFSPPEIVHFARLNAMPVSDVISRLHRAGLDTIPGGGAEILTERVRCEISPNKCSAREWLDVMRVAHDAGMRTTATMMFAHKEAYEDRIEHLARVRELQDSTHGFTAFIPWTFQPLNTQIGGMPAGGVEYLKTLAISRLFLDNVPNIQASWVTQGSKIAQLALRFGANDLGSTMIEENVVRAAGARFRMSLSEMRDIIEDAGFVPRQRDCYYNLIENPRTGRP